MMIWDFIRDFIVQYITGGTNSSNELFETHIGYLISYNNGEFDEEVLGTADMLFTKVADRPDGLTYTLALSDWLATTLTIIIMILIVVFAIWLVRWVFKAVSSAFLLK